MVKVKKLCPLDLKNPPKTVIFVSENLQNTHLSLLANCIFKPPAAFLSSYNAIVYLNPINVELTF